jgi:hypothetical protein
MKFTLVLGLIALSQSLQTALANEQHPRLFLSAEKVSEIRAAIEVKGSHHAEAFGALKSWVDQKGRQPYDPPNGNWNYDRAYMARGAALVAVITGQREYAELAFVVLKDVHDKPDRDQRLPDRVKTYGLAKATVGEGFALAYDWCYNMWNQTQRDYIKDVLKRSLDVWPKYSHSQLQVDRGSNWAAVCRGAELVMLLASYEDLNRPDRLKYLTNQLARHMAFTYGPGGLSQEGIGYTGYGGTYLLEACYALAQTGDNKLIDQLKRHAFWKLQMFTGSSLMTPTYQRRYLQQGVSGTAINDEGWVSQTISSVPKEQLPYFGWFYDRQMGRLAPGTPDKKYDNNRAAWIWALIHYPPGLQVKDPVGAMDRWHFDKKTGGYFFRNRWRDENDILCAVYSDLANHKAWDKREATGIRLIAHGTAFFGGPSKSNGAGLHSRLLIDGKADAGKNSGKNGKHIVAEGSENGGYIIVGGGDTYRSLGVDDLRRHLFVEFSREKNSALLSTLDRIHSTKSHIYTWNVNLGDDKGDDGIKVSAGTESGRSTFLLPGKKGWVKGWVLHPADAITKAGDPLQIETKSADADIWVLMMTGENEPPIGRVSGEGLGSTLEVGDIAVRYNTKTDRIVVNK